MRKFWIHYNNDYLWENFKVEEFGWHDSVPRYLFEEVRTNDIIHFVKKGICHLTVWDGGLEKNYVLKANDAFYIKAGVKHRYVSDEHNPCFRYWLSFCGTDVDKIRYRCGFSENYKIMSFSEELKIEKFFHDFYNIVKKTDCLAFDLYAIAFKILSFFETRKSHLAVNNNENSNKFLLKTISEYIDINIKTVTVKELSGQFGYEKSYLYRLFKENIGLSVQQYIINRKMIIARGLLMKNETPISDIAYLLGYSDESAFTKAFKKYAGETPAKFSRQY